MILVFKPGLLTVITPFIFLFFTGINNSIDKIIISCVLGFLIGFLLDNTIRLLFISAIHLKTIRMGEKVKEEVKEEEYNAKFSNSEVVFIKPLEPAHTFYPEIIASFINYIIFISNTFNSKQKKIFDEFTSHALSTEDKNKTYAFLNKKRKESTPKINTLQQDCIYLFKEHPEKRKELLVFIGDFIEPLDNLNKSAEEFINQVLYFLKTENATISTEYIVSPYHLVHAYETLDSHIFESLDSIKTKYRAFVKENHPDIIKHKYTDIAQQELALEEFHKVRKAYDAILLYHSTRTH